MPGIAKIRRAPRAANRGEPVADRRAGEFEITGGEIEFRQARAQSPLPPARIRATASGSRLPWPHSSTAVSLIGSFFDRSAAAIDCRDDAGRRPSAAADRRPRRSTRCLAICRRSSAMFRIPSSSPAARSHSSTASSTAKIRSEASRRERGIVTVVVLVGGAAAARADDRTSLPRQPARRRGRMPC